MRLGGATENLGYGPDTPTSLPQAPDRLEDRTGERTDVAYDDWREGDQKVYVSDISRAREALDWEPRIDFETGVDRFVEWYGDR